MLVDVRVGVLHADLPQRLIIAEEFAQAGKRRDKKQRKA